MYLLCLLFRLVRSVARGARAYFIAPRGIYRAELKSYGDWAGKYIFFFLRRDVETLSVHVFVCV